MYSITMATPPSVFPRLHDRRLLIFLCILLCQTDLNETRRIWSFTVNNTDFRTRVDQPIVFPVGVNVTLKCNINGKWFPSPIFILDRDERLLTGTSSLTEISYTVHKIECMHRGPYRCKTRDHKDVRQVKMASIDLDVAGCPPQMCTNQSDHATIMSEVGHTVSWRICIVGRITKLDYPKLKHTGFPSKNFLVVKKLDRRLDRNYGSRLVHFIEMTLKNIRATDVGLMNITVFTDTNKWFSYTVDIQVLKSCKYDSTITYESRTLYGQPAKRKKITNKTVSKYSKSLKYFIASTTSRSNHISSDQPVFPSITALSQRSENTSNEHTHLIIIVVLFVTLLIGVSVMVVYLVRRRVQRKRRLRQQRNYYSVVAPLSGHYDNDRQTTPPLPPPRIPQRPLVNATILEHTTDPPPYCEVFLNHHIPLRQSVHPNQAHYNLQDHNVDVQADGNDTVPYMSSEFCNTRVKQLVSVNRSNFNHITEADHLEPKVKPKMGFSERPKSLVLGNIQCNFELDYIEPRPMSA